MADVIGRGAEIVLVIRDEVAGAQGEEPFPENLSPFEDKEDGIGIGGADCFIQWQLRKL